MKQHIQSLIAAAVTALRDSGELALDSEPAIPLERARDLAHGDFASPVALGLSKAARRKPRDIAELIVARLPASDDITQVDIAGPGFINFFVSDHALQRLVKEILTAGDAFGRTRRGEGRRVQVEFVSANPTGPLHVGHGRGAAYGAVVANLLSAVGCDVAREYYVNDAGRQMDILAASVWLRYLELCGEEIVFPSNGYRGDYVWDIAATLHRERGDAYRVAWSAIGKDLPPDEPEGGDKEAHVDTLIAGAREHLGEETFRRIHGLALSTITDDIRKDLAAFGVVFDEWFSERSLIDGGAVDRTFDALKTAGHVYERDGPMWFRSTDFGDEKDRVLIRSNGQPTYLLPDIAYHMNKFERGFERLIDVWGADHHGHVPRMKAALAALGKDANGLDVLLVQFANLYRGGERVQMSTRSGSFVTLRELREEVGKDAARFFYVMRKSDQHLDFDLDLAKSKSNENPVYYVQYAHARICSVLRQLAEKGASWDRDNALSHLEQLTQSHEFALLRTLSRYPEVVESAALACEPHQLSYYVRELANDFHTYYNAHTFLVDNTDLRDARLALISAVGQVIRSALDLLGVSAPESM